LHIVPRGRVGPIATAINGPPASFARFILGWRGRTPPQDGRRSRGLQATAGAGSGPRFPAGTANPANPHFRRWADKITFGSGRRRRSFFRSRRFSGLQKRSEVESDNSFAEDNSWLDARTVGVAAVADFGDRAATLRGWTACVVREYCGDYWVAAALFSIAGPRIAKAGSFGGSCDGELILLDSQANRLPAVGRSACQAD